MDTVDKTEESCSEQRRRNQFGFNKKAERGIKPPLLLGWWGMGQGTWAVVDSLSSAFTRNGQPNTCGCFRALIQPLELDESDPIFP